MRRHALVLTTLIVGACRATEAPAPAVAVPPPAPLPIAAPAPAPAPKARAPMRALILGAPNELTNAAWTPDGAVAITTKELWRFRPEAPTVIHTTPLARPVSLSPVLAVARPSGRVAVALEDGSVDVFEKDGTRLRTLAPGKHVLELRFAPDGKTLAISRRNDKKDEWYEKTFFVDVTTDTTKSAVEGGNVAFDAEGKRVAARGGVHEVETGRAIATFPEGFHVLLDAGVIGDRRKATGEFIAGDYLARGWSGSTAFYSAALGKDVALVDPSGTITRIAASCAPGKKLGTDADRVRGRMIATCSDGVVVTDIAKRTSTKIAFPLSKRVSLSGPEVVFFPESDTFSVKSLDMPIGIFDPVAGTARRATSQEADRVWSFPFDETCSGAAGGRSAALCDNPAWRPDGAYRMRVHWGFELWSKSSALVADWGMDPIAARHAQVTSESLRANEGIDIEWRAGAFDVRTNKRRLRYRMGPARDADVPAFPPTAACGTEPYAKIVEDGFAVYSSWEGKDRITSTILCHCTASGCVKTSLGGMGSLVAAREDGAFVTIDTNSYMTETTVTLRAPGKRPVTTKLPGSCIYGSFGPGGHVYLPCEIEERETLVELSVPDLAVVRRRTSPLGRISRIARAGDALLVGTHGREGSYGALLDEAWLAADDPLRPTPLVYAWPTFGILQGTDGKVTIHGDEAAASFGMRCFDGKELRPFDDCRGDVIRRP